MAASAPQRFAPAGGSGLLLVLSYTLHLALHLLQASPSNPIILMSRESSAQSGHWHARPLHCVTQRPEHQGEQGSSHVHHGTEVTNSVASAWANDLHRMLGHSAGMWIEDTGADVDSYRCSTCCCTAMHVYDVICKSVSSVDNNQSPEGAAIEAGFNVQ